MQNIFRNIVLRFFFLFCFAFGPTFALDVVFDTKDQLDAVSATSTCNYYENYEDLCKYSVAHPGSSGFWSSCSAANCEITIPIGKILATGELPSEIRVVTYLDDARAEIRLRYRVVPGSIVTNMNPPIPGSTDWAVSPGYDLESISGLNSESEIIVRLSSNPFIEDSDLLDKIILSFDEQSTDPTHAPTTQSPSSSTSPGQTTSSPAQTTSSSQDSTSTTEEICEEEL